MNFDRQSRVWRVRETEHCLFHLEPPLHEDEDLAGVIEGADARYLRVREALGLARMAVKERERRLRLNYWLYGESAIADADMPLGAKRFSTGAGSPAGIVFAVRGFRWSECVPALTHETIHVLWGAEVGEAPSILNEGVAEYFQALLAESPEAALRNLGADWMRLIDSGAVSLRDLCRNEFFWRERQRDSGLPSGYFYRVSGAFAGYLADERGLPMLREIFLASHYWDEALAATIERLTGQTMEALALGASAWWRRRLDGTESAGYELGAA